METWWLSFCDPHKPKGQQFLGVIIIEGIDFMDAHLAACELGINPGGEVFGTNITEGASMIDSSYKNRLLNRSECDILNGGH